MVPRVIFNQTFQVVLFYALFFLLFSLGVFSLEYDEEKEEWWNVLLSFFANFLVYDFFLFAGHFGMHRWKKFYKVVHKLHHTTFASVGGSAYYMTLPDFFFESMAPGVGMIALLVFPKTPFYRGFSHTGYIIFNSIGAFHTVCTHSAWRLPFLPDPTCHFIHHNKQKYNIGAFITDTLFSTSNPSLD